MGFTKDLRPFVGEYRRARRSRTLLGGKVVFRDGSYSLGCMVRDMSDDGARLAVAPDQLVPARFYLITSRRNAAFDAELLWRRGALLGAKFHGGLDLSDSRLHFVKALADELQPRPQGACATLAAHE